MSTSKACPYEVLGVAREATSDEISRAYKTLAKKHHPDRHATMSEDVRRAHAEAFKEISDAHDILSNADKRHAYDMYGHGATSAASDDVATNAMFEQMFGVGASAPKKPRGVLGGAMFWDGRQFFQRRSEDVDGLRREMIEGLPEQVFLRKDGTSYEARAPLPCGQWEVRWVETDDAEATVTLLGTEKDDIDAESTSHRQALIVTRTFALPSDADWNELAVSVDEKAGIVMVRADIKHPAPTTQEASEPLAPAAVAESLTTDSESTPPSTPVCSPPRPRRQKARVKGGSTLRAGFLNGTARKPRRVNFEPDAKGRPAGGVAPMEVDEQLKENNEEALNAAIRTQLYHGLAAAA